MIKGGKEGGREGGFTHTQATYLEHAPGVSLEDGGGALDVVPGRDVLLAAVCAYVYIYINKCT